MNKTINTIFQPTCLQPPTDQAACQQESLKKYRQAMSGLTKQEFTFNEKTTLAGRMMASTAEVCMQ